MKKKALTEKVIVLGVDGFDPKLAKKLMDQGKMPALKEFTNRGSAREDLMLLGALPTVTPPLWTTLSTGAYPGTHGITCFFASDPEHIDTLHYNLDSRKSKAEPLWNIFAQEADKKTLVWHWPGSSWPPTSESPNLHVVDGTQPSGINNGISFLDILKIVSGSDKLEHSEYLPNTSHVAPGQGCIIDNAADLMEGQDAGTSEFRKAIAAGNNSKGFQFSIMKNEECEIEALGNMICDTIKAAIKPFSGWTQAPEDTKEFMFIVSNGLERRPGLILKNEEGIYDTVALYKTKKDAAPYLTLKKGEIKFDCKDTVKNAEGETVDCNRNYQLLDLEADGSKFNMIINNASQIGRDDYFHPKTLYKEVVENIGNIPVNFRVNGANETLVRETMLPSWEHYCTWQAKCLTYFMENNKYDIIFSHLHNIDGVGHYFWHYACNQEEWKDNDEKAYQEFQEETYRQTDRYLKHFLPFLDQGWTIIITSDHGLITQEYHGVILGEIHGVNVPVMAQLGYTVMVKDENGNDTKEIDWSKTKAVAIRGDHIYINLKGRNPHGIVEPEEQYELETQIISDLYNYRDPHSGRRVISIAMRNRDAIILGMNGPECGDIIYFTEEGFNKIHADSLSTQCGYADTSVSPIFVAAGPGIKANHVTERVIRQVDVTPTIATITGVRMPAQCEGAPIYQIIEE